MRKCRRIYLKSPWFNKLIFNRLLTVQAPMHASPARRTFLKPGSTNQAMGVNPVYQNFVVLTMHGFSNANYFLTVAFISVVSSMSF